MGRHTPKELVEEKDCACTGKGRGGIAPVADTVWRDRPDQQIADHASTEGGCESYDHQAKKIEFRSDAGHRAFDGEDQNSCQIDDEQKKVGVVPGESSGAF